MDPEAMLTSIVSRFLDITGSFVELVLVNSLLK